MINLNSLQIVSCALVILIQVYRYQGQYLENILKGYFNILTVQVYIIIIYNEIDSILQYLELDIITNQNTFRLYEKIQNILFLLSLSVFIGIAFIIFFLINLKKVHKSRMHISLILIQTFLQTLLLQFLFLLSSLIVNYFERQQNFFEILKVVYIRILLLISALSSMQPILEVLLEIPLQNFKKSLYNIKQPFIKDIKFKSVLQMKQLQTDEELAQLNNDQESMLIFEDNDEIQETKYCDCFKSNFIIFLQISWNGIKIITRSIYLIYNGIQLILALVLIFGFVCILIQAINPNSDLLTQLNAIDFFTTQVETQNKNKIQEALEIISIAIFKFIFLIVMYFSTNNKISYSKNKELIGNITNLTVAIRRNLLNFTLIALLTTLYPGLSFTINNSNCYRNISNPIDQNETNCPITLTYLITQKVFSGPISISFGLCIIILYIMTSIQILFFKRSKNLTEI